MADPIARVGRRGALALHALAVIASATALHFGARVEAPWHWLFFVAFVPWLAALDHVRSARAALASGLVMSIGFALGVFSWFAGAMSGYAGAHAWIGQALLVALAPLLQPQIVVFALARQRLQPARRTGLPAALATLGAACAYVAAEWALPKLFEDTVGHGLLPSPRMRQAADLGGVPLLTLALVCANETVLRALRGVLATGAWRVRARRTLVPAAVALGVAALLSGYGAWRLSRLDPGASRPTLLRAALVQADLDGYERLRRELGSYDAVQMILDRHFAMSEAALAAPIDVVIWPETVYPTTFGAPRSEAGAELDRRIAGFAAARGVPLVFGAYDTDPDPATGGEYNAAFFLGSDGSYDVYRKAALFPLTERVPAWLDSAWLRRALPWLGTWQPGRGPNLASLSLADGRVVRVLPLVCYDAVEPALSWEGARAGAELIVTLSNDSWFASGGGPRLHLVVSAFRSIETRLPQIRATNTGISAVIDPTGELLDVLAVHERGVLVAEVPAGPGQTPPVTRFGAALGPAALGIALAALLALRSRRGPYSGTVRANM